MQVVIKTACSPATPVPDRHVRGQALISPSWFPRCCVDWAMADHMRAEFVVEALEMALWQRRRDSA
jgi:transposase InsO family protein